MVKIALRVVSGIALAMLALYLLTMAGFLVVAIEFGIWQAGVISFCAAIGAAAMFWWWLETSVTASMLPDS